MANWPGTTQLLKALSGTVVDEPTGREIAWIATYGPSTADDAIRVLASSRARSLLEHEWLQECPLQRLFDIANGDTASDTDEAVHAKSVRTLLTTLHTTECRACAAKLH